jgi:hypothetical protein
MRKLVESTFVTLDGVIGDPRTGGRPTGTKSTARTRPGCSSGPTPSCSAATYEAFAQAWPQRSGASIDRINEMPKHVASRSLTEAT